MGQRGTIQTPQGYQISTGAVHRLPAAAAVTEEFPWKVWLRNAVEQRLLRSDTRAHYLS